MEAANRRGRPIRPAYWDSELSVPGGSPFGVEFSAPGLISRARAVSCRHPAVSSTGPPLHQRSLSPPFSSGGATGDFLFLVEPGADDGPDHNLYKPQHHADGDQTVTEQMQGCRSNHGQ